MRLLCACCAVALMAGCVLVPSSDRDPVTPWLGTYRGSFDSALTSDPGDDLNHDPGDRDLGQTHHEPLKDVLLHIDRNAAGDATLAFYRTADDRRAGHALDLLGAGCGTRLGPGSAADAARDGAARAAADVAAASAPASAPVAAASVTVLEFPIHADNRLCLGKLRPVSRPTLQLALVPPGADGVGRVRLVVDRNVRDANYLYVEEEGVRRRVRIDRDNIVDDDHQRRYRVCIEDDFGEYDRCVLTDREFRSFALPIPVPGGVAVSYTWWQELRPRLQRTRGRYEVTRDVGRFERLPDGS